MTEKILEGVQVTPEVQETLTQEVGDGGEVGKLRAEAAKWRTQLRDAQAQLKELQPLAEQAKAQQDAQKSEAQKLTERLSALEAELVQKQAAAERAQAEALVIRLATKAGVDPDVAALLDFSKLNLEDEGKALETLGKLARSTARATNPGRAGEPVTSDSELRALYFGNSRKTTIFGG